MPRISQLYFRTAVIFLIIGILMGLNMAISQDHSVIGAHAHCNLLGWVTMAIFGGYHALNPQKAEKRLAMIQYYVYTAGIALMSFDRAPKPSSSGMVPSAAAPTILL